MRVRGLRGGGGGGAVVSEATETARHVERKPKMARCESKLPFWTLTDRQTRLIAQSQVWIGSETKSTQPHACCDNRQMNPCLFWTGLKHRVGGRGWEVGER